MDMECDEVVWTFYINPKKRDTIKPTVCESVIGRAAKETNKQAAEQENANDTKSTEPVQTKKIDSSDKGQSEKNKSMEPVQTKKNDSPEKGQSEKESKS